MTAGAQIPLGLCADPALPRIVFVLGKGGVGRTTVAAGLALAMAGRGERVLVLEWTVADPIGPWFGAARAGPQPTPIAPGLAACNFSLDEALRAYFVDHLHLGLVYRHVLRAAPVARMLEVAPGLGEMFFLGELWWLVTLAEREAGWRFDRIVVDAPATGHAASLLDVPATLAAMGAAGLLAVETRRVAELLADPARTGAIVVSLPEPLVVDETLELLPRVTARLGRPPLALIVNRSAGAIAAVGAAELDALAAALSPPSARAVRAMHGELAARAAIERAMIGAAAGATRRGAITIAELPGAAPREVVGAAARALEAA